MKHILESAEVMAAYAQIDYCHYALESISKELGKPIPIIDKMVYNACNYHPIEKHLNDMKQIFTDLIEAKKVIEADYSADEEMLKKLNEYKKNEENETK